MLFRGVPRERVESWLWLNVGADAWAPALHCREQWGPLFSSLILGSASRLLGGVPPLLASSLARGSCSATFVCLTAICPLIISFGAYMKPALGIRNSPFFLPGSVTVSFVSGALC